MKQSGNRRAVILAGGKGTRLRPYTVVIPKPLVPVGDYPILEIIIRQLARAGFDRITLSVNHQAELIKAFFADGARWGTRIDYSLEDQPLGTMGPLKLISDLPDNFLVMNGDVLTDLDYQAFHDEHVARNDLFTISAQVREQMIDYGVLKTGPNGELAGFEEKPRMNYEVSMGIYMLNRQVLGFVPDAQPMGFDGLMHKLLGGRQRVCVRRFQGYWLDIGRPDDYQQAISDFEVNASRFLLGDRLPSDG